MPRRNFTRLHDAIELVVDGARMKSRRVGSLAHCWLEWDGQSLPITRLTYERIRNRNIVKLESRDGFERTYTYAP